MPSKPFFKLGYFAIPLIICIVLMDMFFPKPEASEMNGYSNFILAFEFAETPSDLDAILKPLRESENGTEKLKGTNTGNYADFAFMLIYSTFLFLFAGRVRRFFHAKWLLVAQALAVLILFGDIFENIQLIGIANHYIAGTESADVLLPLLAKLKLFTWLKWLSLAALLFIIGAGLLRGAWLPKVIAAICCLPILFYVFARLSPSPTSVEIFALSNSLAILGLVLSCFFIKNEMLPNPS